MLTRLFDPLTVARVAESPVFPIVEFTLISSATICIYLVIHVTLNRLHISVKVLVSMLFGTVAYSLGKVAIVAYLAVPKIPF